MKHSTYRLTDDDLAIMARLRERLGLDSTGVIRYALRRIAQQEGITMDKKQLTLTRHDGSVYAILGDDALAAATGKLMTAMHGGHVVTGDHGLVLYHNGACVSDDNAITRDLYTDLYNRTLAR